MLTAHWKRRSKLASHNFINHDIEIIRGKSSESCFAFGYPNELVQVLLNVLSNAKDAIVEKKVRGKPHAQVEQRMDTATISIRDNGGGISDDILPKIFDPYFTTKTKGGGVGPYMSRMIMEYMGI